MVYIIIAITVLLSINGFSQPHLVGKYSLNPYRIAKSREWYRIITHAFFHGNYMHLFINMFVFWSFGSNIEHIFDALKTQGVIRGSDINFLLLYFGAVVFSSIPDLVMKRNNYYYSSIGASGAVAAILFASIFFSPWSMIYLLGIIPIPAILFGVLYVAYESYLDKRNNDNINHKAHLWGALYGFIFIIIMDYRLFTHFITLLLNPPFFN